MTNKTHYPKPDQSLDFAALERDILKFWQDNKIFEKSVEIRNYSDLESEDDNVSPVKEPCALKDHANCRHDHHEKNEFVFYDGPPFANGLPHYGHLLTGFIKDLVARYQTMKGKKVERKFGWDTHGLPVEMETEKELGVSGQIAIQEYGIEKFNEACRKSVMKYADQWKEYVTRQGRFVDFENGYKTMDANYMESVLWAFKQLYDKGLIYEGFRVVPYSWACQTPLSNFETRMDNSYRQKASKAVTVKFELDEENKEKLTSILRENSDFAEINPRQTKISFLAWTTTPWTLPSNLALGVGEKIEYAIVKTENEFVILAKNLATKFAKDLSLDEKYLAEQNFVSLRGSDLIGLKYKALFPYLKEKAGENSFQVFHGDFVSTEDGTGIVHMAPGFGEDDQILCQSHGIPTLCPVDEGGKFTTEMFDLEFEGDEKTPGGQALLLKGRQVFETNDDIIKFLKAQGSWVKTEQILHNYPHCWRTDTPLIYKAVSSWYVKVTDFRDRMVELNSGKSQPANDQIPLKFETSRLRFEAITKLDDENLGEISELLRDKDVRHFYYYAPHQICDEKAVEENMQYYISQLQKKLPRFKIFDKESGEFAGLAGFCFYDPAVENLENGKVEISYQFHKKFWGKGFGNEIGQALIAYGFKNYAVDKIVAATVSDNFASKKILEKFGFEMIYKSKNSYPKGGKDKNYEQHYYELARKSWEAKSFAGAQDDKNASHDEKAVSGNKNASHDEKNACNNHAENKTKNSNNNQNNQGINWIPDHIKDGQFGKWLEGARDWSITRNRFWGCPVPVWVSDNPEIKKIKVFGSLKEMQDYFGRLPMNKNGEVDLHRPYIDELIKEEIDEKTGVKYKMKRVTDVLDCWFESGSMPYAQIHYPFENKEWFEENFPADFITEYLAQTRGWFYTMTVLSTAIFDRAPFKNVICHGTILDENSQKLSKRLKNYPDPIAMFDEIGSDALRFYMASQPVMKGQELKIDKEGKAFRDALRLSIKPLINAYNFFCLYANSDGIKAQRIGYGREFSSMLDNYILAKLKDAVKKIDESLSSYDTISACQEFEKFFEALNNWFIRRSRQRFWKSEIDQDKQDAYDTLFTCLVTMCEASAPLLPFVTEFVWKGLVEEKSGL